MPTPYARSRWWVRAPAARRPPRRWCRILPMSPAASARLAGVEKAPMQRHEGGYYIRMLAVDKPGTAARIATCFAEESISLESIMQRHFGPRPLPVILITYATTEDAVRRALAKVEAERVIEGKPQLIRIEKT